MKIVELRELQRVDPGREAFNRILDALEPLSPVARRRVLAAVAVMIDEYDLAQQLLRDLGASRGTRR